MAEKAIFGFERGKRNRQLHIQGVCQIRFPGDREYVTYLRRTIYDSYPARPCDGYKVSVETLKPGQTWELMAGYCMKDNLLAHFRLITVGVSERDYAVWKAMYGNRTETYVGDREVLYKRTLFNVAYCFYMSFLRPLQLNFPQVARRLLVSGRYCPSDRWLEGRGRMNGISAQLLWWWTRGGPVRVQDVTWVFLDNSSMILDADGSWARFQDEEYQARDRRIDTIDFDEPADEARSLRGEEDAEDTAHRDFLAYSDVVVLQPRVVFRHGRSFFPVSNHDANDATPVDSALDPRFYITGNASLLRNRHTPPL